MTARRLPVSRALALCLTAALTLTAAGLHAVQAESEQAATAGSPTMRRLNEDQYRRSIAQIFGPDIEIPGRFEPSVREEGLLAVGASRVVVTPSGAEQYAIRAREMARAILDPARRNTYLHCPAPAGERFDEACAREFLGKYGRLLFRRPLTDGESATAVQLAKRAAEQSGSFYKGLETGLASLLVSPAFVFRIETVENDPAHPGGQRLDAYSLASRISFLLWDGPPDEALLDAAASGALRTGPGLERQVDRLMASPKLEQGVRAFFSDMLAFDQFDGLSKDAAIYPIFNPQLRRDAQEQSLRTIVDHLLARKADYRDLFTTKKTFLTRSLGALYGVKVDYRGFDGWMPYTFGPQDPHAGLLTLPAFLMLDPSHEGRSSPTIRGVKIRENLLCQKVPSPPANVNFNLVQDVNDPVRKTARLRLTAHQENPVCAACHKITDPIGLALENYNPVGAYRSQENGVSIDASGTFENKPYRNGIELMALLHDSPAVPDCIVHRIFEYGAGRPPTAGEEQWLADAGKHFAQDGYRFPALLRNVAVSDAFQAASATGGALALRN